MKKARVTTTNLEVYEIDVRVIDMDDQADRQWLGDHAWWAVSNGHDVTVRRINNHAA